MAHAKDQKGILYQNLKDAGCSSELTDKCMECLEAQSQQEMIPMLKKHRDELRNQVRTGQKQIDALDYLLFRIEKSADKSR